MKQKDFLDRLKLLDRNGIPWDAKIIIDFNNVRSEVHSLVFDLDDYDDPDWGLNCNEHEGDIDISDETVDVYSLKAWAEELTPYVSDPITFGKLKYVMNRPRTHAADDEVFIFLSKKQIKSSPKTDFGMTASFAHITMKTKFEYVVNENAVIITPPLEDRF